MRHISKASIILIFSLATTCLASSLYSASAQSLNKFESDTIPLSNNDHSFSSFEFSGSSQKEIILASNDEPFYMSQPLIFSLIIGALVTVASFIFFKFWKKRVNRVHQDLDESDANLIE